MTSGHFVQKCRAAGIFPLPAFRLSGGGELTATTRLITHHISKGETVAQSLKDRFDYGQNPEKTQGGELISAYECDHRTADAEFLLAKAKYKAAALLYLREHGLTDYAALEAITEAAVDRFHALAGELRDAEAALSHTSQLMGAVVKYAKTRPVFDGYKAARYSKKYLAQHEAELADYRAAKAAINELLDGAKLPKMDALKKERRELAEKKKALYAEYRKAQADMREAVAVKGNIDFLLGHTDGRDKAQER